MERLDQAIANTRAHLLALMNERGHWEGRLSSSALSTATAIVALSLVDAVKHDRFIKAGAKWLAEHQNTDGGWGDTTVSKSNLSTTLLCWSALGLVGTADSKVIQLCEIWIRNAVGSLRANDIVKAVVARYGKDKTFSVPILMMAALCGRLGENAWQHVLPLPFELAVLPRAWFGTIGLPVVSYALPALIAIGHARFYFEPPPKWSPMRWLRAWAWKKVRPMLRELQPSSGGYLEATPLTSFVTMALAGAGEKDHPCVPLAVEFLQRSMREDGSWPIDTNLATWGTTLAIKALDSDLTSDQRSRLKTWLLDQQYTTVHPFTNAAPGGWAWTDLPGGVPDADDTAGALIALHHLCRSDDERREISTQAAAGVKWLLDLQNRDGGVPTFCRGWGTLPFDRSAPELTTHALWAWHLWLEFLPVELAERLPRATERAYRYLTVTGRFFAKQEAARIIANAPRNRVVMPRRIKHWEPLWFGNENAPDEANPIYGTAAVLRGLLGSGASPQMRSVRDAAVFLMADQQPDGSWGGAHGVVPSIEETAVALAALAPVVDDFQDVQQRVSKSIERAVTWLIDSTKCGTQFPSLPIGLYFARLWYHEQLYPVIWTLAALKEARCALALRAESSTGAP
jgi:squalene-hopene/tetraprenyl-beta-curcumene cyclase